MPYPCGVMRNRPASLRFPSPVLRRFTLSVVAAASLILFGCQVGVSSGGSVVGSKPQFRMKSLDGRVVGPGDFPGKVVVVDFWATWCGPCHLQAEFLESLQQEYKGKSLQILGANVGEGEDTVRRFLKARAIPYPVLMDPEDKISGPLGINALPTVMIVDKKGKVTYFQAGITDLGTLRRLIRQAGA
jgi:thiol-disulfide isomerase/thioredoxin